jgi:hypothetical protein
MKTLIVITVDLPKANRIADVLGYIDPPRIPYFNGEVRVVVGTDVDDTIKFLDEE